MRRPVAAVFGLTIAFSTADAAKFGASAGYSHLHPKHIALECRECHSLRAHEADIHEMPNHSTCSACHNFAKEAVQRTEDFCGECHTSTDATKDHPALFNFPRQHARQEFGDQFSHAAHKNAGTATRCEAPGAAAQSHCADCHAPDHSNKKMQASHTFCFACHCESPRGYKPNRNDCAVCHVVHAAKLVSLADVRDFRHADHIFDTRPRRKDAATVSRDPDVLCVECHKTAAESHHLGDIRQPAVAVCLTCHTGKPGLPDVLPADILRPLETAQ